MDTPVPTPARVRIPIAALFQAARERTGTNALDPLPAVVARAGADARPVAGADPTDDTVLEALAMRVLAGEHPARAATAVGLRAEVGPHVVRTSVAYAAARQRALAATPKPREAILREVAGLAADNAYRGALVQDALLRQCDDPQVLARVSTDAMDRVGARAPTRTDNTVRHELSAETLVAIERMFGDLRTIETHAFEAHFVNAPTSTRDADADPSADGG